MMRVVEVSAEAGNDRRSAVAVFLACGHGNQVVIVISNQDLTDDCYQSAAVIDTTFCW